MQRRTQPARRLPQTFQIKRLIKKLDQVCAFVRHDDNSQLFVFERYTAMVAVNILAQAATIIAFVVIGLGKHACSALLFI
jgi:hypothetical protein